MVPALPHKLDLYRLAVQHPQAEAAFLTRLCSHYRHDLPATRLKEDFAGTGALAAAWVALHEDHRALAVEAHGPTVRWAQRQAQCELGARTTDLHVLQADVLQVTSPRVDIVAALNFSTFIYHERAALRSYFQAAHRSLRPGGLLVVDGYGGPGAWRLGRQTRRITLKGATTRESKRVPAWFDYVWEQRTCDAVTGRVDCHIHFHLPPAKGGRWMRSAFRYDWRLWSLPELTEIMIEAGFRRAEVWCDRLIAKGDQAGLRSDGIYRPVRKMEAREDWIAYVVGVR